MSDKKSTHQQALKRLAKVNLKQQRLPKLEELTVNSSTNKAEQTSSGVTREAQDKTLHVLTHHNQLKTKCPRNNVGSQRATK